MKAVPRFVNFHPVNPPTSVQKRRDRRQSSTQSSWVTGLKKHWQHWVLTLTAPPSPRVWQGRDRQGHTFWNAYDPVSGDFAYHLSEAEARAWLEQRYYR